NFIGLADLLDFLQITGRRQHRPERSAAHWFEDHRGGLTGARGQCRLKLQCILTATLSAPILAVVSAAVAIRRADGGELAHHGPVDFRAPAMMGNGYGAQRGSMLALIAANNLRAPKVANFNLILTCQLQGKLHRIRAAGSEVDGTALVCRAGKFEQLTRVLLGNGS